MEAGVLRASRPARVDGVLDLRGLYLMSPDGAPRAALDDGSAATFVARRADPSDATRPSSAVALRVLHGRVQW